MDRINNFNNYKPTFSGTDKDKPQMLDKTAKMNILVPKSKEVLSEMAEREVPENGQFKKVFVRFNIPETNNVAVMTIEHDEIDPKTQRRLSIGTHHQNRDKLTSVYVSKGTKQEIMEYLKDPNNTKEIIDTVNHLSNKTDDDFVSL